MRFSQRIGKAPVRTELEKEGMSDELRNGLWSVFKLTIETPLKEGRQDLLDKQISEKGFYTYVWLEFFKKPVDEMPPVKSSVIYPGIQYPVDIIKNWFFEAQWFEVFDFVEYCMPMSKRFRNSVDKFLALEMSAYRFVDDILIQINSEEEVIEIETALSYLDSAAASRRHLVQALTLLSDRKQPDYRNSIKESISAVESLVKTLLKDDKATLGQALKIIEENHGLHPALKSSFSKLYGYTSDSGGIRHAMKEGDPEVDVAEARFMLVTCSAFVNYLITKLN